MKQRTVIQKQRKRMSDLVNFVILIKFQQVVRAKERLEDNEFKLAGNKQGPDSPS